MVSYLLVIKAEEFIEETALEVLREKLVFFEPYFADGIVWRDPETIKQLVQMAREAKTRLSVLDESGAILMESEVEEITLSEKQRTTPELREAAEQDIGIAKRYSDVKASQTLYTAKKIHTEQGPLFIRLGVPVLSLQDRVSEIFAAIAIGACVGVGVSLLFALFLVRRITGPLSEMTKVAESISHGDYEARIHDLPRNEIGSLGQAINRLAEAVQANIARREKMELIRREFSSNISHELKTPLTSIRGYVDTLLAGALHDPKKNVRFLRIIESNTERMSNLVNDLLRLATIEANQEVITLEAVDWRSVVQDVIIRQQPKLNSKNIELILAIETDETHVRGNGKAMSHILDNLLVNAILYTAPGGKISIIIRSTDKGRELIVKDNGMGISQTDQARIFERFFRVDPARTKSEGGTGLGLAIVKHLVMQLQGSIEVESEIGQGTAFTVRLPKAQKVQDPGMIVRENADAS
jgi:two-component system phosphate regulon sensor histidine kinase PhoR